MSRIDLTPALTTTRGSAASVPRSADSSNVCCAPRWTPPRPPVEKTFTPARWARCAVAATVVPALRPLTAATGEVAQARLHHVVGRRQSLDLVGRQSDRRHAVDHADRRRARRRAPRTRSSASRATSQVRRPGESVREDRRLQREHGSPGRRRPRAPRPTPSVPPSTLSSRCRTQPQCSIRCQPLGSLPVAWGV